MADGSDQQLDARFRLMLYDEVRQPAGEAVAQLRRFRLMHSATASGRIAVKLLGAMTSVGEHEVVVHTVHAGGDAPPQASESVLRRSLHSVGVACRSVPVARGKESLAE